MADLPAPQYSIMINFDSSSEPRPTESIASMFSFFISFLRWVGCTPLAHDSGDSKDSDRFVFVLCFVSLCFLLFVCLFVLDFAFGSFGIVLWVWCRE